VLAGEDV